MKKDVIYIDIEDDITAIIGKVKDASAKIVALVPPKRTGVLQSAVNLKLLQKSAASADKRVVLITNDHSLTSLAAGVKIPVAKNLQSRPEIPQIAALQVDDEDVINGEDLPVGELAAAAGMPPESLAGDDELPAAPLSRAEEISSKVDLGALSAAGASARAGAQGAPELAGKATKDPSKKVKIPNFNTFRKKVFIGGALLLIGVPFFMWAVFQAPKAQVTITAKTSEVNIDRSLTLVPTLPAVDLNANRFKPHVQELKKSVSVDFDATGTKEIGEKAAGAITVSNATDSEPITLETGTQFVAASGQKFVSTARVTVPGAKVSGGSIKAGVVSAAVQAAAIGPEYNVVATSYTIQGYEDLDASGQPMSGGSRETVKVVTDDDVTKARERLTQQDSKAAKTEVQKQFSKDFVPIPDSFGTAPGDPVSAPAVGEQATKAKLTAETLYTMSGLAREDVGKLITKVLDDTLKSKEGQTVYDRGDKEISFQQYQYFDDSTARVRLLATSAIGPKINTEELAQQLAGKRYGEIEQAVQAIEGVEKVAIDFSPFWVSKAPNNPTKIDIKFSVTTSD